MSKKRQQLFTINSRQSGKTCTAALNNEWAEQQARAEIPDVLVQNQLVHDMFPYKRVRPIWLTSDDKKKMAKLKMVQNAFGITEYPYHTTLMAKGEIDEPIVDFKVTVVDTEQEQDSVVDLLCGGTLQDLYNPLLALGDIQPQDVMGDPTP